MAKYMRMEHLLRWNKTVDRQPTAKPVLTRNGFMSKKSSYRKQMVMKESSCMSKTNRFKIMAEMSNKGLISTIEKKPYPASIRLLRFLLPFLDCAMIEGLSFSGFIVAVAVVFVAVSFLGLLEYLKMWRWLRVHQLKARRGGTRSTALGKWAWIEDLVYGVNVSDVDDLFFMTYILVGLGFVCGLLVLFRSFYSKIIRK